MRIVLTLPDGDLPACVECRVLDLDVTAPTLDAAARQIQPAVTEEIAVLGGSERGGWLTAAGCRRLARLRQLGAVLGGIVGPTP
jgi:hypothetical protein